MEREAGGGRRRGVKRMNRGLSLFVCLLYDMTTKGERGRGLRPSRNK